MSGEPGPPKDPIFSVPGHAADHLYREGSAHASFWEAIFGSSLRAKRRTRVSALQDGTRMLKVEDELLRAASTWMKSEAGGETGRAAAALIESRRIRARLIGLQPRGQAIASFALRFEAVEPAPALGLDAPRAFASWFGAEGARIAAETLIPFGFTPQSK
jgi:hypothetical protein